MTSIAKTVVADATKGDDCFLVDGKPFPWFISEEGPTARRITSDWFWVRVTIIQIGDGFSHHCPTDKPWPQPVIDGIEFPWWISEEGFTYRSSGNTCPTIELEFLASSVEGVPVVDETDNLPDEIWAANAKLLGKGWVA